MGRKVLLVHWGQTGGGGPRFTYELARCWEERYPGEASTSFNVNAESAADYRALDIPRLEVRTYRRTKSGVLLGLYRLPIIAWRLRRFLRKHDVGAVVCVMTSVYQWMIVPRILPPSARYIVCVHDTLPHPGEERPSQGLALRSELDRANIAFVFSQSVASQLEAQIDSGKTPIVTSVHPAWSNSRSALSRTRRLPEHGPFTLGFFGRLLPYKGLDLFLDAARLLTQRGVDVRIAIHGTGPDRNLRTKYTDVAGDWDVRWIEDSSVETLIDRFDVLVLPYKEASQSGVFAHALDLGIPTVATPVGGLIEQIEETGAGVLASHPTAPSVADAIECLLADPGQYETYSKAALLAARTTHGWARLVDDLRSAVAR